MGETADAAASETVAKAPADSAATPASRAPSSRPQQQEDDGELAYPFQFTGSGGEYFRIWVVNVLLTFLTLGIYSAWAKVRRTQYFYRNTRLAGSVFDYRGNPKAILKGRVYAFGLLAAYNLALEFSPPIAIGVGLLLIAVLPWLLARAFRFRMVNSTYRNVRFHFHGTTGQAYRMLAIIPVMIAVVGFFAWSMFASFSNSMGTGTMILLMLLIIAVMWVVGPLAHYLLKRYQHDNAYFGHMPFFFEAGPKDFFKLYAKAIGWTIVGSMAAGGISVVVGGIIGVMGSGPAKLLAAVPVLISTYLTYIFYFAYLEARVQNLVWTGTSIAGMRFESTVRARKLLSIHATNLILIPLTLGLYKPFAVIRRMKYKVENMVLLPVAGNLEDILADHSAERAGAVGDEAGELFNIDIAI